MRVYFAVFHYLKRCRGCVVMVGSSFLASGDAEKITCIPTKNRPEIPAGLAD